MLFPTLITWNSSRGLQGSSVNKLTPTHNTCDSMRDPYKPLPIFTRRRRALIEAGALCIVAFRKNNNFIFRRLYTEWCMYIYVYTLKCIWLCVCLSAVWERVYSQVLADILGLCGCGWWLACCADNREGTVYFIYLLVSVCVSLRVCISACVSVCRRVCMWV